MQGFYRGPAFFMSSVECLSEMLFSLLALQISHFHFL